MQAAERLADPAFVQRLGHAGGLPDIHRAEVRLVRIRITDALHDAERPVFVQFRDVRHRRMQADRISELLHLGFGDFDRGPEFRILGVLERNDSVQPVIASRQLYDDEDRVLGPTRTGKWSGRGGAAQERRHAQPPGDETGLL